VAAAWQAGCALDLDQAVEAALAITAPESTEPSVADRPLPARDGQSLLTRRELEVAVRIAQGLTNREIAEVLVITEGTAANHVNHILNKLDFSSRAQIAVWVTERGLGGHGANGTTSRG
jgi:DNA-binding NarL/FixJ family response regulator